MKRPQKLFLISVSSILALVGLVFLLLSPRIVQGSDVAQVQEYFPMLEGIHSCEWEFIQESKIPFDISTFQGKILFTDVGYNHLLKLCNWQKIDMPEDWSLLPERMKPLLNQNTVYYLPDDESVLNPDFSLIYSLLLSKNEKTLYFSIGS
jgi:hypothetical protein